jgi:putative colanic acid biosynthesis acetyltransferase WcaF
MIRLDKFQNAEFSRGASRLKEVLWWLVRSVLFMTSFPVPSALKVKALRLFGSRVGHGVVIRSRVNITFPWRFSCGDHVWIGDEVLILSLDQVTIGSHVCISQRAFLCTGSHDHRVESFDLMTKAIQVEDSCWIGAQVFVGPGVQLGQGSVVAAGAVLVRNVEAGTVVGGNPARPLRASSPSSS